MLSLGSVFEMIVIARARSAPRRSSWIASPSRKAGHLADSNLRILPRRDSGYTLRGNQFLNASYSDMTVPHAAGAMYSTTHDLWRWAEATFGDKLLTPASRAKLLTPMR